MRFLNTGFLMTILVFILLFFSNCEKIVEIPPPINSISTVQVFENSKNAEAAVNGVYSSFASSGASFDFGTGSITKLFGMYADELIPTGTEEIAYSLGRLNPVQVPNEIWASPYKIIYRINAVIDGLQTSTNITSNLRSLMLGEMKVLRGLAYYYLVNAFGYVPYVTTIDWQVSAKIGNPRNVSVLDSVISDIESSIDFLRSDFVELGGNRTRVSKWSAYSLLAKIYLLKSDFTNAKKYADLICNQTDLFDLESNLNNVFLKSSKEAILQWDLNTSQYPWNATSEGMNFNRYDFLPLYYLNDTLISAFSQLDKRIANWLDSTIYEGKVYFFPFKYKLSFFDIDVSWPVTELYTVFRLSDIKLILAEADVQLGNISSGVQQLNKVRARSGLDELPLDMEKNAAIDSIFVERQRELFCEWGSRFIDLKRSGRANAYLSSIKANWEESSLLFPIPVYELLVNPFLKQNDGY